jgi:hypothetical protein
MRRNYTPRTRVEFQLVVSLVSNLAVFGSFGSNWMGLFGNTVVSGLDALFTLPADFLGGSTTPGLANTIAGGGNAASSLATQVNPGNAVNLLSGLTSVASLIPGIGGFL